MSSGEYWLGVVLLAVVVGSAALAGRSLRRVLLPTWGGAPARLAESVCAVAALTVLAEVAGSVGEFRRWPVIVGMVCVAAVAAIVGRRYSTAAAVETVPPQGGRVPVVIASIAVATIATRSLQAAGDALHGGMLSFDTLWYHL